MVLGTVLDLLGALCLLAPFVNIKSLGFCQGRTWEACLGICTAGKKAELGSLCYPSLYCTKHLLGLCAQNSWGFTAYALLWDTA